MQSGRGNRLSLTHRHTHTHKKIITFYDSKSQTIFIALKSFLFYKNKEFINVFAPVKVGSKQSSTKGREKHLLYFTRRRRTFVASSLSSFVLFESQSGGAVELHNFAMISVSPFFWSWSRSIGKQNNNRKQMHFVTLVSFWATLVTRLCYHVGSKWTPEYCSCSMGFQKESSFPVIFSLAVFL